MYPSGPKPMADTFSCNASTRPSITGEAIMHWWPLFFIPSRMYQCWVPRRGAFGSESWVPRRGDFGSENWELRYECWVLRTECWELSVENWVLRTELLRSQSAGCPEGEPLASGKVPGSRIQVYDRWIFTKCCKFILSGRSNITPRSENRTQIRRLTGGTSCWSVGWRTYNFQILAQFYSWKFVKFVFHYFNTDAIPFKYSKSEIRNPTLAIRHSPLLKFCKQ